MRLTNLADVLREAGLTVVEVDGWQTRGRGGDGGQYLDGRPSHVMLHHTAGSKGASASSEVNYMVSVADAKPIANLYVARDGDKGGAGAVWVIAAGPTNTNGRGSAPWANGLVKTDDMNRHAIGVEVGLNGLGEAIGTLQEKAVITLSAALCAAYNIPVNHCRSHAEYSPGRKIDVAGPSSFQPEGGTWRMDRVRELVQEAMTGAPAPKPEPAPKPDPKPEPDLAPVGGVDNLDSIAWYINKNDTPWAVSLAVYGTGTQHTLLDAGKFNSYSTPGNPVFVTTPAVAGTRTTVLAGEGAAAVVRRLTGNPAYPKQAVLNEFYKWNGGNRAFSSGDVVHLPADAR